jgi:hypothetical protein
LHGIVAFGLGEQHRWLEDAEALEVQCCGRLTQSNAVIVDTSDMGWIVVSTLPPTAPLDPRVTTCIIRPLTVTAEMIEQICRCYSFSKIDGQLHVKRAGLRLAFGMALSDAVNEEFDFEKAYHFHRRHGQGG